MREDVSVDGNMKTLSSFAGDGHTSTLDFANKMVNDLRISSNLRDCLNVEEIKLESNNRNVMTLMSTSQCQLEIIGDAINHLVTNKRQDG